MSEPVGLLTLRELVTDALLGGSGGYFLIPAGGRIHLARLKEDDLFRVEVDLRTGGPFDPEHAAAFNAETFVRVARLMAGEPYA